MVKPNKVGVVVSQGKMDKTVKVRIRNSNWNRHVSKYIVSYRNMLVHDELNKCREGDVVRIEYARPLSARKSWAVAEFIRLKGTSWEKYQQEIPGEVRRDEVGKLDAFTQLRQQRAATNGEAPEVAARRAAGAADAGAAAAASAALRLDIDQVEEDISKITEQLSSLSFMAAEAKRILAEEPQRANDILSGLGKDPLTLNASIKRNLIRKHLSSQKSA